MLKKNSMPEAQMLLNKISNGESSVQDVAIEVDASNASASKDAMPFMQEVSPRAVEMAVGTAADFMIEMEPVSPWRGGNRQAHENWQSLIALAGLMKSNVEGHLNENVSATSGTRLSVPREAVTSDYLKEFGARGLQLFLDIGFGFGAHQLINQVMATHNVVGQAHSAAAAPNNSSSAASIDVEQARDVGSLYANSNALGFAAPSFVSGSAAFVAGHMVGALLNTPRTVGPQGATPLREFGQQQVQNFLFNMPGMIGGFTAANLVLSGIEAAGRNGPGVEWLLWSLGGGLGGAFGGTMNMLYRVRGQGHQVQDIERSWAGKMQDLKNLDFQTWMKFIPAHLASLTPIQYQGTASSALVPGTTFTETLARRSVNTVVLQLGFWGLHGNVQKLAQRAMNFASQMGAYCNDRLHICSPRHTPTESAVRVNEFLNVQSQELVALSNDLSRLLDVLHHAPEQLGETAEPLRAVEEALACLGALHTSPPISNERGEPTQQQDIDRWYKDQQEKLRDNLKILSNSGRTSNTQSSSSC